MLMVAVVITSAVGTLISFPFLRYVAEIDSNNPRVSLKTAIVKTCVGTVLFFTSTSLLLWVLETINV